MNGVGRIAWTIALTYLIWVVVLFVLQRRVVFPRHVRATPTTEAPPVQGLESIQVSTPEGPVVGWFLPPVGVPANLPTPAVLFAHGNAELIDDWVFAVGPYRKMGLGVLLAEYRGYGRAPGHPSQDAIVSDFVQFHDALSKRPDVDETRIVYHGRSLGGGVVCALSLKRPPAAMVLQSTFTSVASLSRQFLVPSFLVRDVFDNIEAVTTARFPIHIAHGTRDNTIPFAHAETLAAAATKSSLLPLACSHNDCPPDEDHYWGEIEAFFTQSGVLAPEADPP